MSAFVSGVLQKQRRQSRRPGRDLAVTAGAMVLAALGGFALPLLLSLPSVLR